MSTQVGQTILQQLGGNRFRTMTGAASFSAGEFPEGPGLSMKLPGGKGMIITLNGRDLYDLKLLRSGFFRKDEFIPMKVTRECLNVGVEQLRDTFTEMTGLYTSLAA
jgi:hypothetical protein